MLSLKKIFGVDSRLQVSITDSNPGIHKPSQNKQIGEPPHQSSSAVKDQKSSLPNEDTQSSDKNNSSN